MEWPSLLLGTIVLRPYVFVFLAVYLTIAILNMGLVRSIVFTVWLIPLLFYRNTLRLESGSPMGSMNI